MPRVTLLVALVSLFWHSCATANAESTVFFNASQVATPVASGVTSDTISSNGYLFTLTRDKLFTGGLGHPIGRQVRVPWPQGVEAQAVTTPPPGVTDYKARITLQCVDADVFDLKSFTAKLLANTAGAGGSIEIMPLINGDDAFNDPLSFDATGIAGNTFSYNESPNPWGSTALLKGFDTYKIGLYVDFAFTALTLVGAPLPGALGDYNQDGVVDAGDYTVWRDNLNNPSFDLPNEGATEGTVTEADFDVWRMHFGETFVGGAGGVAASMAVTAVPEPAVLVILLSGVLLSLWLRRSPTTR